MISRFNSAVCAASLLCILPGCVDQISVDLPPPAKRLVVNSILTPDSVFRVQVSRLTSTTDSSSRLLSSAQVSRVNSDGTVEVLRSQGNGLYFSDNKPVAGGRYTVLATAPDYLPATATDTIPAPVSIREAWYAFPTGTDRNNDLLGTIVVRFDDPAATANFYEISAYQARNDRQSGGLQLDVRGNAALAAEEDSEFSPPSLVFSDKLFNGRAFELRASFLTNGYFSGNNSGGPQLSDNVYLVLRSVSRAYYQYRKSWTRHRYNQGVKDDGFGNGLNQLLFLGDPTPMTSNVRGGYGVVAGYSKQKLILFAR